MGMTSEEMGRMTLAELEATAERFGAAVETIREAQALLGGSAAPVASTAAISVVRHAIRPPGADNPLLTQAENAERRRLIKLNTEPIDPDDLATMERQNINSP